MLQRKHRKKNFIIPEPISNLNLENFLKKQLHVVNVKIASIANVLNLSILKWSENSFILLIKTFWTGK